jgi:hypothetical protein
MSTPALLYKNNIVVVGVASITDECVAPAFDPVHLEKSRGTERLCSAQGCGKAIDPRGGGQENAQVDV